MKTIKYFFAVVGFSLCFLSCSSEKEETLPWFNFGEAVYDEPFVGLLESRPWILVKSLQYPPFSWVAPDTVTFKKKLDVTFNNECIRSKSEALIQFKDSLYMPVRGVIVSMNGKSCPDGDFTVSADSISKKVSLQLVISPAAGDTVFNGFVLIRGKELDKANGVDLQQENNVVASWTAKQEIGWPILLWLFWLIAALLAIVLAGYVLYGIYKLLQLAVKAKGNDGGKKKTERQGFKTMKQEKDLWKILYEYYPEMKGLMEKLNEHSPEYFKKEYFEIKRISKKGFRIRHKYEGRFTKIEIEICGNEIRAKAGASLGEERYDGQLNSFLNYPLPNKKYIVDDGCFVYETDKYGRVVTAKGDINKSSSILQRRQKGRLDEYPSWVKEMDGAATDDGGHIFACSLNGPAEKINIVPMDSEWQRPGGEWYEKFENVMRKNVAGGKIVNPEIKLLYKGRSKRPYAVKVRVSPSDTFQKMYNPLKNNQI